MSWFIRMVGRSKKNHAFTLVELVIVVVIVGVLAAVAIAIYRGYVRKGYYSGRSLYADVNKRKAMATEGAAGLGTVRTALRAVFAETSDYTDGGTITAPGAAVGVVPGIDDDDLDGTYFDDENYTITAIGVTTFALQCAANATSGRGDAEGNANGITVTLNQDGDKTYTYTAP